MKNMKRKIGLISVAVIVVISAFFLVQGKKEKVEMTNPRTDIEVLQKWFPKVEGMESASWEVKELSSSSSRVPGPSAFWAKGFIYLEKDTAEKYLKDYDWQEVSVTFDCEYVDTTAFENTTWYYSKAFEEDVKPYSYIGNFYFNGEVIWFDVTR